MLDRLKAFEGKRPEIVFSWKDSETEAEGWVVINSLRGGAAGGGTRMRKGLNMNEVLSLAKTMEVKFSVCGPPIGGAKSGINFDPADPRKEGVLRRWYAAVLPLLKAYYGTGGDLNVDEIKEVLPITAELGLLHCQEGVAQGHFKPSEEKKKTIIHRLKTGVSKVIDNPIYTPALSAGYVVADMITGYGVARAVDHYYSLWGGEKKGKRVIIQGFGNVGGAAAFYMAQTGYRVVGIIDRDGGLMNPEGFSFEEICHLILTRNGNALAAPGMIPYAEIDKKIWGMGAEVFLPCARSRVITRSQVSEMAAAGLEVISSGANVPFDDAEIFLGETGVYTDQLVSCIPDFVANCGMARAFAYFMEGNGSMTDEAIFEDGSQMIYKGLKEVFDASPSRTGLWQTGLGIALDKLGV
jgi:glutamate dehydrogenase/leucine dehydrogenase